MPEAYRVLGMAAGTTSLATIYTVNTVLNAAIISSIVICNVSASPTTFTLIVMPGNQGGSPILKNYVYSGTAIDALDTFVATVGFTLSGSDYIQVAAGAANALSFQIYGDELS